MKQYNDNEDNIVQAKKIRAALEKICYEAAPKPLLKRKTKNISYGIFPALLSLKELQMISKLACKFDLNLAELAYTYRQIRDIYWEKKFYSKQKSNKKEESDADFLKSVGLKW